MARKTKDSYVTLAIIIALAVGILIGMYMLQRSIKINPEASKLGSQIKHQITT